MTVELLQTLSLVAYLVAVAFLIVAVALFFLLDVPKLYGEVSGLTARRAIEAIRQQNVNSGSLAYKPSSVNAERGRLTDKITQSGKLDSEASGSLVSLGTEKLATATLAPSALASPAYETTVLPECANETTVLTGTLTSADETTILVQETEVAAEQAVTMSDFTLDVEMSFSGSTEIIE